MTQQAFERGDWQTVIDAHPLESHDPAEWLRYGVALLLTLTPGAEAGKQQQQAALAFVQAQKEGARAQAVSAAQQQAVLLGLREALTLTHIPVPQSLVAKAVRHQEAMAAEQPATPDQTPQEPLRVITTTLARVFALELPEQAAVLDQLLAAKVQLVSRQVGIAAVEGVLRQEVPAGEHEWAEAMQKVLLVLR